MGKIVGLFGEVKSKLCPSFLEPFRIPGIGRAWRGDRSRKPRTDPEVFV
jgi:hypothetical protein